MYIESEPPFRITRGEDDSWLAIRDDIQLTVTADVGECKVDHRVGQQPQTRRDSRWLHVHVSKPKGPIHLFVSGTHVVMAGRDFLPTFDLSTPEDLLARAAKALRPEKDERGAYVVDTEKNRQVLKSLVDHAHQMERRRLSAWVRTAVARLAGE